VEQSLNRSCLLFFAASRTPLNPWDTRSPLCVGLVLDKRCSPWPAPFFSPGSAEDRSSLFAWFIDSMVRSDSSRACVSALRLCTFADRPRSLAAKRSRGLPRSRACCFSACAGSPTTQDRLLARDYREATVVPSSIRKESASWFCVFEAQ